ncbi:butyrophilin subfamily 1 member A1-like isoform X3 [Mustela lutreola]|uniref:butyrophilin subfamily 1 member A1-like isoform X3 n=1 Tax=Mustela lutreola TaxID=9666 RepID=UPI0027972573|nr:butyrophilin subfamily 1 member A1-like isoform X3 [Mustela lutreola]
MTKLSKMMLTALLIMVLFFLNQVTLEKVTRENEREKAHERTQAGRATEREGETGSLLSRDPNAGLHPRIPGSQSELKANTQPTESSMCFKEDHLEENGFQQEIARRKAQYKAAWRKAQLYPDWRKEEFQAVNVTLDEDTAHPSLLLSENRRQVTWQESHQDLSSSTQRFDSLPCVLGQQHISSGRSFWEVKVKDAPSWDLGICLNNVTRKGMVTLSPQHGFWAIRFYNREYWALTSPETCLTVREIPHCVGIFLDYEDGDVSFYNMTDGSHIFSFTKNTFSGALRPLLRLWSSAPGTLTICPMGEENGGAINITEQEK